MSTKEYMHDVLCAQFGIKDGEVTSWIAETQRRLGRLEQVEAERDELLRQRDKLLEACQAPAPGFNFDCFDDFLNALAEAESERYPELRNAISAKVDQIRAAIADCQPRK